MKKIIAVILTILLIVLISQQVAGSESDLDLELVNLTQNEYGIGIDGILSERESAIWDILELNFVMAVCDIEDIFEINKSIHQFKNLSTEGVIKYEMIIREYVNNYSLAEETEVIMEEVNPD